MTDPMQPDPQEVLARALYEREQRSILSLVPGSQEPPCWAFITEALPTVAEKHYAEAEAGLAALSGAGFAIVSREDLREAVGELEGQAKDPTLNGTKQQRYLRVIVEPLRAVLEGGDEKQQLPYCLVCNGTGGYWSDNWNPCGTCGGGGLLPQAEYDRIVNALPSEQSGPVLEGGENE